MLGYRLSQRINTQFWHSYSYGRLFYQIFSGSDGNYKGTLKPKATVEGSVGVL